MPSHSIAPGVLAASDVDVAVFGKAVTRAPWDVEAAEVGGALLLRAPRLRAEALALSPAVIDGVGPRGRVYPLGDVWGADLRPALRLAGARLRAATSAAASGGGGAMDLAAVVSRAGAAIVDVSEISAAFAPTEAVHASRSGVTLSFEGRLYVSVVRGSSLFPRVIAWRPSEGAPRALPGAPGAPGRPPVPDIPSALRAVGAEDRAAAAYCDAPRGREWWVPRARCVVVSGDATVLGTSMAPAPRVDDVVPAGGELREIVAALEGAGEVERPLVLGGARVAAAFGPTRFYGAWASVTAMPGAVAAVVRRLDGAAALSVADDAASAISAARDELEVPTGGDLPDARAVEAAMRAAREELCG